MVNGKMLIMTDRLNKWIIDNLNKNGWAMNELARRGNLTSSYVSMVLSGRSEPGPKFYLGVSKAFGIPI
jgi:transcriptional regulator with XRE-family HTH domain